MNWVRGLKTKISIFFSFCRSLEMIEEYIRKQVLPLYGNTHTTTTVTSLQTTLYRHEARYGVATTTYGSVRVVKLLACDLKII